MASEEIGTDIKGTMAADFKQVCAVLENSIPGGSLALASYGLSAVGNEKELQTHVDQQRVAMQQARAICAKQAGP